MPSKRYAKGMDRLAENMEMVYDKMTDLLSQVKAASGDLTPALELLAYDTGPLIAKSLSSEISKSLH